MKLISILKRQKHMLFISLNDWEGPGSASLALLRMCVMHHVSDGQKKRRISGCAGETVLREKAADTFYFRSGHTNTKAI